MLPTLKDVLELPVLQGGRPQILAGADHLDHPVRWAHVTEVADIGDLLRGNELILSTGVALPRDEVGVTEFIAQLAKLPVAGLIVELGRAYAGRLPTVMIQAANRFGLPLIALTTPVAFVEVTEAVHSLVLDGQVQALRQAQSMHETFTELAVEGADTREVIRQAARMAGAPVVLETLGHLVVEHDGAAQDDDLLLSRWASKSRAVRTPGRAGRDPHSGWVVATVGARGEDWGRLILVRPPTVDDPQDLMLVERTATTLALHRLITRDRDSLERQTHRTLLTALLEHQHPDAEIALRSRALGVSLDGRRLLGAVVRWRLENSAPTLATQARLRDLTEATALAVRDISAHALIGQLDDRTVGILIALDRRDLAETVLDRLGRAIHRTAAQRRADPVILAAGSVVAGLRDARRTIAEARQVAEAASHLPCAQEFLRLHNVGVRGLLALLHGDARIETFVDREIGHLIDEEPELLPVLRAYLAAGRNKSAAATAMHLSRPAFYDRLTKLSGTLAADLDDVETCLTLHLALLAHDTQPAETSYPTET